DITAPACREGVYVKAEQFFKDRKIPSVNLAQAMNSSSIPQAPYLKTDTHWSPAGAHLAAQSLKKLIDIDFPTLRFKRKLFCSQAGPEKSYNGDLMRYVPGVGEAQIQPDRLSTYSEDLAKTEPASDESLFGGPTPPITLVGTSYSANRDWNFEGFLKETLK